MNMIDFQIHPLLHVPHVMIVDGFYVCVHESTLFGALIVLAVQ